MQNKPIIMPAINESEIYQIEEKKSKFLSIIYYVETEDEATQIISQVKIKYNDAKHVVYAYRLINKSKYSDDKEPQNTAGKPIYDLLEKKNIVNMLVIVIRYFGGILLGTGLLSRTYAKSALNAINNIELIPYIKYEEKEYIMEYKDENKFLSNYAKEQIVSIERLDKVKIIVKEKIVD